ncbi:MAG: serine/threonine-protein kinase [Thermoguttaceae bacterium]
MTKQSEFERCTLASGLLTKKQIAEVRAGVRWSDEQQTKAVMTDQELADRLVETGKLNRWQAMQLLEGRTKFNLGPYWIVDSIGQGGMGQVFKAEHSVMERVVAIKVLPKSKSTPEAVDSFTREIRALASLDHNRLVRALDAGHDGNVYYLVCEYVPGCDLRKLVRRDGPLPMKMAAGIIYQVAEGLDHAHRQGLIHRDVKPGNVLVTPEGEAKLSDLGLAGPLDADAENDPRYGKIVGTADYLSPDHVNSPWEPTPAWDIYSLGCTLYYAVTGNVPFPIGSTKDKIRAHRELHPLDPRRLNSKLTDEFVDFMADLMAKDPAERISSAAEVMSRLAPWLDEPLPISLTASARTPAKPPIRPATDRRIVPAVPPKTSGASSAADVDSGLPEIDFSENGFSENGFSENSEPLLAEDESLRLALQATAPVNASDAETSTGVTSETDMPGKLTFLRRPLVLLPLVLAAAVTVGGLIWWLAQ